MPGRLPLVTPPLENSARPMSLITGMTHKCPVGRGCVGESGALAELAPMGFQPLGGALGGHPHLSCWVAPGTAPGFMQAGWQPEGARRGLPAAGLEPPSPWDGVCVKMRSSWGQAPRGQTSAKSRQNPSEGQQSGPKVWALLSCSFHSDQEMGRGLSPAHSGAEELLRRHHFLQDAAPWAQGDNKCPQRKWAQDPLCRGTP